MSAPSAAALWSPADAVLVNHGSFGRVPTATVEALTELLIQEERNPSAWERGLTEALAGARHRVAEWLGTPAERTGFVANASSGVTVAFDALGHRLRDRPIIATSFGYGATLIAAQRAADRYETGVQTVPLGLLDDADTIVEKIAGRLSGAGALLIDQITSGTARMLPVQRPAALAREHEIPVIVDAAHAPGMLPRPHAGLDDVDFWVGNLHKWPCSARGAAVLVVSPEHLDTLPPVASWYENDSYATRFDRQGTGAYGAWLTSPRSIEVIEDGIGWDRMRADGAALVEQAQRMVAEALGTSLVHIPEPAPLMRLVALPEGIVGGRDDEAPFRQKIAAHGVETAITSHDGRGFVRLSAHAYNAIADYERLAEVLTVHIPNSEKPLPTGDFTR